MRDEFRDAGLAILGTWLLSGLLQQRAEHTIRKDFGRAMHGGTIQARVEPSGYLGHLLGRSSTIWVKGRGFSVEDPVFRLEPGGGPRSHARRLRLEYDDFLLRGVRVSKLTADLPDVSVDLNRALFEERLVVRAAGFGKAEAIITQESLQDLVGRKYPQLSAVRLTIRPGEATLAAKMSLFGRMNDVVTIANLIPVDGRYVYVTNPRMTMNGLSYDSAFANNVIRQFNPVLDIDRDLGLGGFVYLKEIELRDGFAIVRGDATVPKKLTPEKPQ